MTLFSLRFNKSFKTTLVSERFGALVYILEKEKILFIAPTNSLMLAVISLLIKSSISLEIFTPSEYKLLNSSIFFETIFF